jgi:hypothetical protein
MRQGERLIDRRLTLHHNGVDTIAVQYVAPIRQGVRNRSELAPNLRRIRIRAPV